MSNSEKPDTTGPQTTVIIVTYESKDRIDETLYALHAAQQAGSAKVVVVDNESVDGTAAHIRRTHPWVTVIDHGGNFGFARGCNRGFEEADTPYTLFLNPDAVLTAEQLTDMVTFMAEKPDCGACAPAIRNPDGGLQRSGMMFTPGQLLSHIIRHKPLPQQQFIEPGDPPKQTNWICGAIFMVRTQLYAEVGMMDPRFFMYFEETDLCRKIARASQQIWTLGHIVALHHAGSSAAKVDGREFTRDLPQFYYPSRYYYLSKNHGRVTAFCTELLLLLHLCARSAWRNILGKGDGEFRYRRRGGFLRLPHRIS